MVLSRAWYLILALITGAAVYVVSLAVGQYNRRNAEAMADTLKGDSQVVGWALQIDSRRRIDSLLASALRKEVIDGVKAANGKETIPEKAKTDSSKALTEANTALPADYRNDVMFAVDRDGRVVGQVGYDAILARHQQFELGGYAAVFDALHGYLRDDTWVWGGKIARVATRPIEDEAGQAPVGAIVALRWVDQAFAREIGKRTRTSVTFFALGQKVATGTWSDDKDESDALDLAAAEIPKLEGEKSLKDTGRTDVRALGDGERSAAIFARLPGDAWEVGAGYGVVRNRVSIDGPMGFIKGADDKDKANVKLWLVAAVVIVALGLGMLFSIGEHTIPLRGLAKQSDRLRKGQVDALELTKLRGVYRRIGQDLNAGIERVVEKGGGVARKPADLESILGPVPAQPAMSAFSFPLPEGSSPGMSSPGMSSPGMSAPGMPPSHPSQPGRPPVPGAAPSGPFGAPSGPGLPGSSPGRPPPSVPGFQAARPAVPGPAAGAPPGRPPPSSPQLAAEPPMFPPTSSASQVGRPNEEEATMVGRPAADLLAAATGEISAISAGAAGDEATEWMAVYEEFVRTKKQCGEPTEGLTFEKFQGTLRKNRDQLIQRHGCKRVKFSVYIKEGRASLKATPVRE